MHVCVYTQERIWRTAVEEVKSLERAIVITLTLFPELLCEATIFDFVFLCVCVSMRVSCALICVLWFDGCLFVCVGDNSLLDRISPILGQQAA